MDEEIENKNFGGTPNRATDTHITIWASRTYADEKIVSVENERGASRAGTTDAIPGR